MIHCVTKCKLQWKWNYVAVSESDKYFSVFVSIFIPSFIRISLLPVPSLNIISTKGKNLNLQTSKFAWRVVVIDLSDFFQRKGKKLSTGWMDGYKRADKRPKCFDIKTNKITKNLQNGNDNPNNFNYVSANSFYQYCLVNIFSSFQSHISIWF